MGRPRAFDEHEVTASAADLFAARPYDAISVDDLVAQLGVHRNSLYKVFGSKRGLYLAALHHHLRQRVTPLLTALATAPDPPALASSAAAAGDLDLLLLAAADRAPADAEVARLVTGALDGLDQTLDRAGTAVLLGNRLRDRAADGVAAGPSDGERVTTAAPGHG
jgi:TetR/AcrR family transcriptional repressor of nem operon